MRLTASPIPVDFDRLLAPIAPDDPSGPNLRYEGTYDHIRELRREEGELPQGVWQTEAKRAEWTKVSEVCSETLTHRSKDLQIAGWLLESWLCLYGFEGVAAGFQLLADLIERFWDTIHPEPVNGDLEYRASPFTWINEKLVAELRLIPFVYAEEPDPVPLSWSDWELACLEASGIHRNNKGKKAFTQDDFQRALHLTPFHLIETQFSAVSVAISECSRTQELLDRNFRKDSPSLQNIRSTLDKIYTFLEAFIHHMSGPTLLAVADAVDDAAAQAKTGTAVPVALPHPEISAITSRAEAYHWLAAAAEYLSRTEPHSPTPYLVRRAIRWGNLTLEELLPELVRNQGDLEEVTRLLQLGK